MVVPSSIPPVVPASDQVIVNPQTGKRERVFVNLRALYPSPDEPGSELSFEEVWAARRGWLDKIWEYEEEQHHQPVQVELVPLAEHVSVSEKLVMPHDAVMLDENGAVKDSSRQGRGKKKKVMEINETHISGCIRPSRRRCSRIVLTQMTYDSQGKIGLALKAQD